MFNGYWGTFIGVKCPGCDTDQAPLSTIKVKNEWNCICFPHIPVWWGRINVEVVVVVKAKGKITLKQAYVALRGPGG
jgi:hypothetical protein